MNPHGRPRYSILIPSRNGVNYLPYAIESVLSQQYLDFELIVSDNHSTDGTSSYLSSISDSRFRHIKPEKLLSMSEHFEFLVSHARGDWIALIGDDDGLMPQFFEKIEKLNLDRQNVEAVVFERAYYFWDGCQELYGNEVVIYLPARGCRIVNNKYAMFLCIISVLTYTEIPQIYTTGLVKRTYYQKIQSLTGGKFFFGRSPDASSAAALALHNKDCVYCNEPLFWVGSSPKSTGYAHSFEVKNSRTHEFQELNRLDNVTETEIIPKRIAKLQDFAVIFYDALLVNPATGPIWKTRLVRNLFLSGLVFKRPELFPAICASYGGKFLRWEIQLFVPIVRFFARRHASSREGRSYYNFGIHSQDRAEFPTLREASAAVKRLWDTSPGEP